MRAALSSFVKSFVIAGFFASLKLHYSVRLLQECLQSLIVIVNIKA